MSQVIHTDETVKLPLTDNFSDRLQEASVDKEISVAKKSEKSKNLSLPIKPSNQCKFRCLFCLVVSLIIALIISIIVLTTQIQKIQQAQEENQKQRIFHESVVLKQIGKHMKGTNDTKETGNTNTNENAKHEQIDMADLYETVGKIVDDVKKLWNKTDDIKTMSEEQKASFKNHVKDVIGNFDAIGARVNDMKYDFNIIVNKTDNQSQIVNRMIGKMMEEVRANSSGYAKAVQDELTAIGNQVDDIEDNVNTLMNTTGIISTSLKGRQFIISSEKQIKHARLFETLSFSSLLCMSDCLKNAHCASFAYDSASQQCIGFSRNCSASTSFSDSTVYYKKKGHQGCRDGWEYHCGSCYFFSKIKANWHDASTNCHTMNAHLAIITMRAENTYLTSLGKRKYAYKSDGYWLDGTDEQQEGNWIWNTTGEALSYTYWYSGEPNNHRASEHCLEMNKNLRLKWNDAPCNKESSQFICEKEFRNI